MSDTNHDIDQLLQSLARSGEEAWNAAAWHAMRDKLYQEGLAVRNSRKRLLLFVLLLICSSLAFLFISPIATKKDGTGSRRMADSNNKPAATMKGKNESTSVQKKDKKWHIAKPVEIETTATKSGNKRTPAIDKVADKSNRKKNTPWDGKLKWYVIPEKGTQAKAPVRLVPAGVGPIQMAPPGNGNEDRATGNRFPPDRNTGEAGTGAQKDDQLADKEAATGHRDSIPVEEAALSDKHTAGLDNDDTLKSFDQQKIVGKGKRLKSLPFHIGLEAGYLQQVSSGGSGLSGGAFLFLPLGKRLTLTTGVNASALRYKNAEPFLHRFVTITDTAFRFIADSTITRFTPERLMSIQPYAQLEYRLNHFVFAAGAGYDLRLKLKGITAVSTSRIIVPGNNRPENNLTQVYNEKELPGKNGFFLAGRLEYYLNRRMSVAVSGRYNLAKVPAEGSFIIPVNDQLKRHSVLFSFRFHFIKK